EKLDIEKEKRKYPRVQVNWPVTIYFDDEKIEGETRNISVDGIFLQTEKPLPFKKNFSISVNPPEHQAIGLKGEAVWSDLYGIEGTGEANVYGLGVCLVELSEEDKQLIKAMINNYL
ncbi:MAG: PilZ domain-containing protein, partial [Desulfobacteraceae bacterium]